MCRRVALTPYLPAHTFLRGPATASWTTFFFNDTATTAIYTLSLHDALPISHGCFLVVDRAGFQALTAAAYSFGDKQEKEGQNEIGRAHV